VRSNYPRSVSRPKRKLLLEKGGLGGVGEATWRKMAGVNESGVSDMFLKRSRSPEVRVRPVALISCVVKADNPEDAGEYL
jgi:hypothetical protein